MGFLRDMDHEVLISYAHADNIPDRDGETGWVEQFERQLSVRLLKRFGESIRVWRDPELARSQVFDKVIEKAVRNSGVLISLITKRYLKSEYCAQELAWFDDQAGGRAGLVVRDDYLRIMPVLLYNVPDREWPAAVHGTSAFPFHDGEGDDFGRPLDPESDEFEDRMRTLVDELFAVLTRMADAPPKPGTAAPDPASGGDSPASSFTIFMSQSADELRATKRQLVDALSAEDIEIITDVPPPYESEEHEARVRAALGRANLCVHLLGTAAGEPLDDTENPDRTYPLEQARIGLEDDCPQLILLPDGFDPALIESSSYAQFMKDLTERERDAAQLEVVRAGKRQMLAAVLEKRRKIEEAKLAASAAAGAPGTAFIDLHTSDLAHASELIAYLGQKHISPLMVPSADLTPTMGLFEDNLRRSQLFLVVYGGVARDWVAHRLNEASKLILIHSLPTKIGVYVAPPAKTPDKIAFPFDVALNSDHFDPGTIEPLLQKATGAGA